MIKRAVFLDRDGVINRAIVRNGRPYPPGSLSELEIAPDVPAALALLKSLGLPRLVVTNQPDVARGQQQLEVIEAINRQLLTALPLDQVYTCYHDDSHNCECRKPRPGLIRQAAQEWQIEPAHSFMIGDRWKDIAAGREAGCTTFFLDMGYAEPVKAKPHYIVKNLLEASEIIKDFIQKEQN